MVKDLVLPGQPDASGVITIVAVCGVVVLFNVVKEPILPKPFEFNPIELLVLVQLYCVPLTAPVKLVAEVFMPLHNAWSVGCNTSGVGLTLMVKLTAGLLHP